MQKNERKQQSNYQRYFEGYTEISTITPKGSIKIERVYTAPFWVHDLTDQQWKVRKLCFTGLTMLVVVLYLCAAFIPLGGAYVRYAMIPGGLTAAILLFLVVSTGSYLMSPRKMTIYEHNQIHTAMRRWPFLSAVALTMTGLVSILYLMISGGDQRFLVLVSTACYVSAAAAAFLVYKIEDKTEYYEEENDSCLLDYPV